MQTIKAIHLRIFLEILLGIGCAELGLAAKALAYKLKPGDRLAIIGDSITEQKLYSKFIETYIVACAPSNDVKVMQFGWSGETAQDFKKRITNDLYPWKPTVVTTCYGMNDGHYCPYTPLIGESYDTHMRMIVESLTTSGVTVVVGTPGVVDSFTFKGTHVYNDNLARLAAIDQKIAQDFVMPFADIHTAMMTAMQKAKAAYGDAYHVAGGDGIHPANNGQLVMAYVFLKALGMDGHIGTLTVNWNGGATATEGHRVLSASNGVIRVESRRYPFCFTGTSNDPASTASILPFCPFQQDLNRFMLVVTHLPAPRTAVQWGSETKTFSREQLAGGINLAAEFIANPLQAPFQNILNAVSEKQQYETIIIKNIITQFRSLPKEILNDPSMATLIESLRSTLLAKQEEYSAKVRATVKPITYSIEITPGSAAP